MSGPECDRVNSLGSSAPDTPSQWQQIYAQCRSQLQQTESTVRMLRIATSESVIDQQARRTIAAMLAKLSSVRDHLEKLHSQEGQKASSGHNPFEEPMRKSTKRPRDQEDIEGDSHTRTMNGPMDGASNAPLRSLKRLRIDDEDQTSRSLSNSAAEGEVNERKKKVKVENDNGATEPAPYNPSETEDISEEVERRIREKEERRKKRWAKRETKRKRGDDDDNNDDDGPAQSRAETASMQQSSKRLRTTDMTPYNQPERGQKRRVVGENGHRNKKRLT